MILQNILKLYTLMKIIKLLDVTTGVDVQIIRRKHSDVDSV